MSNYNSGPYYGEFLYNEGINLEELSAAELDLYIDQGDTFEKIFYVRDEFGQAINLAGMTIIASLKRYYNTGTSFALISEIIDETLGKIKISMSASETAKLVNPKYMYEVKVFDTYATARVVSGQVLISQMV